MSMYPAKLMSMYPAKLPLEVLLSERAEYSVVKPHLEAINLLVEGGFRLRDELEKFLKQRPDEESVIYQTRLDKFTYSNILGSAISQLANKFSNGSVHLEGAKPESFWDDFRENTDGQGRTEKQLTSKLLSELIANGSVFVHVDKPKSYVTPISAAQEAQLGLTPNLVIYSALQVPSWGETAGQLDWLKICQITEDATDPLRKPVMKATWTFIDQDEIARYSAYVKIKDGKIKAILDEFGEEIDSAAPDVFINLESDPIQHGFKSLPVTRIKLPDAIWSGNQAYPKAEECLRLECHRYDLLSASYLQRTYKPVQTPDNDLDNTYADGKSKPLPTGLQYVLEVDSFTWNEPTGAIIEPLNLTLEQAEKQIRTLLAVGGAFVQEAATQVSGASKEMDFSIEDTRLAAYGGIVTDSLQDIYQLVATAQGYSTDLSVSGLDVFGDDRLEDLIANLSRLLTIDMAALELTLTPTLFLIIREKLMSFLVSNLTPLEKTTIQAELSKPRDFKTIPEPVSQISPAN